MALQERTAAALLQGPSRPLARSCMSAGRQRRAVVTAAAQAAPPDGAGGTQQYPLKMSKEARQAETARRIAEARQRVASTQHRVGQAAASAAAAADSRGAACEQAATALHAQAPTAGSGAAAAAAAALALARQEAARADEAVAAVAAAVAGEAQRQQEMLEQMRSQLAVMEGSMVDNTVASGTLSAPLPMPSAPYPALQASIDDNATATDTLRARPTPAGGRGEMLSVASASGAGRQLLAATGRVVAAAAVATAASQHAQAAQLARMAEQPAQQAQQEQPAGQQRRSGWWSLLDFLLAPLAPALKHLAVPPSRRQRSAEAAAAAKSSLGVVYGDDSGNSYDMLVDLLSALTASPGVQGDSRFDPLRDLLAAAPASGVPRYDFVRSLLRGLATADESSMASPFDMARGLLERVRTGKLEAPAGGKYDPVYALLREAALLEDWGSYSASKYDPWQDVSGWAAAPLGTSRSAYDPWADLVCAVREGAAEEAAAAREATLAAAPKYDPLRQWIREFSIPSGASKYDPAAGLLALAGDPDWLGPAAPSRYCPISAALDAAAGWEVPSGASKYCMVSDLLAYEPAAAPEPAADDGAAGEGKGWNPVGRLLDGWAANSSGWQLPEGVSSRPTDDGGIMFAFA